MKNDHSSTEEKYQFERRNVDQKRWSECLIYWWIKANDNFFDGLALRWCVLYTGDCPFILVHTYEWTLHFVWMDSRFCMNAFGVQFRSFLLAGGCTSPHHICHEYWLIASEPIPSSENCHQLNRSHITRRSPELGWGSLQSMTDPWDI